MMYQRILLTDDGTPLAASAARYAAALARDGGEVLVLRVAHDAGIDPASVTPATWSERLAAAEAEAPAPQPFLRHVLDDLGRSGTWRTGALTVRGNPRDAIAEVAERVGADLVVMGSHGYHGLARMVHGSVTDHVNRRLHRAPLLVCHGTPPAGSNPFARVAVTLDETPFADAAVAHASAVAQVTGATLELIRVLEMRGKFVTATIPWSGQGAYRHRGAEGSPLVGGRRPINPADVVVPGLRLEAVPDHNVGAGIIQAGRSSECGVIVMSTHAPGTGARLLHGSVGDYVASHFTCGAVMLVRPADDPAEASSPRGLVALPTPAASDQATGEVGESAEEAGRKVA
ncbi:MAG: universal stress protein [Dehalococcoidia bacterium]